MGDLVRIEHDVVCRRHAPGNWYVRCFTCGFYENDDGAWLHKQSAFVVRRQHIEANTAPPGMEPEMVPSWPWWTDGEAEAS